ncbi:MAG TPA: glycosyltransferase family 2 protein, partial [Coleofasciculaceae cyanobacterium]
LKQAAFHNFVVPSAILNHHFGTPKVTTFLGQKKVIQVYSGLRHFYISRNYTYLELKFSRGGYKVTCGLKRIKRLLSAIVKILLFDPEQKIQKVYACLLGTWDGFTGNLNRKWLP